MWKKSGVLERTCLWHYLGLYYLGLSQSYEMSATCRERDYGSKQLNLSPTITEPEFGLT
jgi:hypothetical protein